MHYYQFSIGDYTSETAYLDELEDLAYRRMLDLYYSKESPLPNDLEEIAKKIRMQTQCERIAGVLQEFFVLEDDGLWHNERADVEIFKFHEKSNKAAKSAKARWKKHKQNQKVIPSSDSNANALQTQCEGNANQEPLTTNQESTLSTPAKPEYSEDDMRLAEWMLVEIKVDLPNFKQPNLKSWAKTIRLMRERDNRNHREMAIVWRWSREDEFWRNNVLGADKFRKQYDQLYAKSRQVPVSDQRKAEREEVRRKIMDIHDTSW